MGFAGIGPKDRALIDWVRSFKTGRKWFIKLDVKTSGSIYTKKAYARALNNFCEFIGLTPDEIVSKYKEDVKRDLEDALEEWCDQLDLFVDWLKKKETTYTTKRGKIMKWKKGRTTAALEQAAIKSFFKANSKVKLPAGTPSYYSKTVPPIPKDDLITIDKTVNEHQRFIIRFLKDSGMSRADVVTLNYGDIQKEFERGERFIHLDVFRGKKEVEYETFIGPNTIEALKVNLRIRRQRGEEITTDTPLFVTNKRPYVRLTGQSLGSLFKRLRRKTGIDISPHKLRKFFETYMALRVRHPIILKYWMGHKVRKGKRDIEAKYIIPPIPEQRKLYIEAYGNIDVSPVVISEEERRIQAIIDNARLLEIPEDVIERVLKERGKTWRKPSELTMRLKVHRMRERNETDCQKIVSEDELNAYLAKGWRVEAILPSGKVVISNERG